MHILAWAFTSTLFNKLAFHMDLLKCRHTCLISETRSSAVSGCDCIIVIPRVSYHAHTHVLTGKCVDELIGFYTFLMWTASSEFGSYRLCEQRRFRRACTSAQSRQNLRCSLIQAVSQEEPSDRKPDPWPLWMAGHAQLKFVMTECSKTQIRLTGLMC